MIILFVQVMQNLLPIKSILGEFNQIVFLDIGYEKTSIIFYEEEKIKFFDILPIGGHHITKDISKVLNISIELI